MSSLFSWIFVMIQRTVWNSNINSPLIPWSVNPFLQYKSSIFGNFHLKWYILHSFKGWRRFMLWALTKNRSILRPYNSDFLLTTTSFIPSWIIMNEMGVSSHKGSIQVIQAWKFLVSIYVLTGVSRLDVVRLKQFSKYGIWNFNIFSSLQLTF